MPLFAGLFIYCLIPYIMTECHFMTGLNVMNLLYTSPSTDTRCNIRLIFEESKYYSCTMKYCVSHLKKRNLSRSSDFTWEFKFLISIMSTVYCNRKKKVWDIKLDFWSWDSNTTGTSKLHKSNNGHGNLMLWKTVSLHDFIKNLVGGKG